MDENRQIDKKPTKQVRIDTDLVDRLKIKAAESKTTIKALVEGFIVEGMKDETIQN